MIKPILAKPFDIKYLQYDNFFIQPKLDGHRAIWDGKHLISRNENIIVSVPGIVNDLNMFFDDMMVDGELYSPHMDFRDLTSHLRKTVNIDDSDKIIYYIFDVIDENKCFEERWKLLFDRYKSSPRIEIVPCYSSKNYKLNYPISESNLNVFKNEYEGSIIRNARGMYTFGKRSSDILKIKEFKDDEATIIGITPLYTYDKIIFKEHLPGTKQYANGTYYKNTNPVKLETMGALTCEYKNKIFEIGTGFTDEQRKQLWLNPPINKRVTFKYQNLTPDGIPRFPVFIRLRDDV